jgi:EF hand domain-containing protein
MPSRCVPLLILLAAGPALAQQSRPAAESQPLRDDAGIVRAQELSAGRVTGSVDIVVPLGETPVTVRSLTPSSAAGQYRIHFAELDVDGDGYISGDEAQANPSLADEFISLDVNRRGKLDREDLAGWLLD